MAHRTTDASTPGLEETAPPDILTMRASASRALPLAGVPSTDDLAILAETLRGHIRVLIPDVEKRALLHPRNATPRISASAAVGEATRKLRMGDDGTVAIRVSVVQKLARSVVALCNHYEALGGKA